MNNKIFAAVITAVVLAALIAAFATWGIAHNVIATECKRLGGFYVGSSTFKCEEVKS